MHGTGIQFPFNLDNNKIFISFVTIENCKLMQTWSTVKATDIWKQQKGNWIILCSRGIIWKEPT